jgi:hypothetical protein
MNDNVIVEMFSALRGNKNTKTEEEIPFPNLDGISKKELEAAYNEKFLLFTTLTLGNPFVDENKEPFVLCESFKFAVSPDYVEKVIKEYTRLRDWQFYKAKGKNGVSIYLLLAKNDDFSIRLIKKGMERLGYFFSRSVDNIDKEGNKWIIFQFDPLLQKEDTEEIMKNGHLYHITPTYNVKSIMTFGLQPRHYNDVYYYPDRIYLFTTGDIEYIKKWGRILYHTNTDSRNDGDYTLLKILVKKINIRLYHDPNMGNAAYTTDPIPPEAIEIIDKIYYN